MTTLVDRAKELVPEPIGQWLRRAQLRAFEAFGSTRYSSPGLRGLDQKVFPHLPEEPGVFLEIGANDGFSQSNTYYLERMRGWRGILIEPVPRLYRSAKALRKRSTTFNRACVGAGGPTTIDIVDMGLMSVTLGAQDDADQVDRLSKRRARHTHTVLTATLSELIDESGEHSVDFMSIDVEGAEFSVLAGLDLDRHTPGWLVIETKYPERVTELLDGRMAFVEALTEHDYLYRKL